jgi:hypothetical protein
MSRVRLALGGGRSNNGWPDYPERDDVVERQHPTYLLHILGAPRIDHRVTTRAVAVPVDMLTAIRELVLTVPALEWGWQNRPPKIELGDR